MTSTHIAYGRLHRNIHWITAGLVALQMILAAINAIAYQSRPLLAETVVQIHLSSGALIFVLTLLRIVTRISAPQPPLPEDMPAAAKLAARGLHVALYGLLLALPVTGYVKLAALGFEIRLFGFVPLPPLAFDPALALQAQSLHRAMAVALGGSLTIHIAAALLHRRLFGSAVLPRMAIGSGLSRRWPLRDPALESGERL